MLTFDPQLAEEIGLNEAIFIAQLQYWSDKRGMGKMHNGKRFIRNTLDQWLEQFPFWSKSTLRRAIKFLTEEGYITAEKLDPVSSSHVLWYAVNDENLPTAQNEQTDTPDLNISNVQNETCDVQNEHFQDVSKMNTPYSKQITTEITTPPHLIDYEITNMITACGLPTSEYDNVVYVMGLFKKHCNPLTGQVKRAEYACYAVKQGLTERELQRFVNEWWSNNGYGDKPHPSQVMDNLTTFREWVEKQDRAEKNGAPVIAGSEVW